MKKSNTYYELQELKSVGLTRHQASIRMKISYRTACKYWDMPASEYQQLLSEEQSNKAINLYRSDIIECLRRYPEMSSAQMKAWISMKRDVQELEIADRTFQKYVGQLRQELNIPKPMNAAHSGIQQVSSEKPSVLKKLKAPQRSQAVSNASVITPKRSNDHSL